MFSKHIHKELSAYCHGELPPEEMRRVAEHLIGCNSCRAEHEEIKLGVKLAEHLPQVQSLASLWADLQLRAASEPRESVIRLELARQGSLLRSQFMAIPACCG